LTLIMNSDSPQK